MAFTLTQTQVQILKCDNGYLVDWRRPNNEVDKFTSAFPKKESGIEVFTKLNAAIVLMLHKPKEEHTDA